MTRKNSNIFFTFWQSISLEWQKSMVNLFIFLLKIKFREVPCLVFDGIRASWNWFLVQNFSSDWIRLDRSESDQRIHILYFAYINNKHKQKKKTCGWKHTHNNYVVLFFFDCWNCRVIEIMLYSSMVFEEL